MKNIIYIAILILFTGCGNFLDEYSQDLVVPKTVSDLNEVLLGNGYVPSSEVQYLRSGSIGWQLNILDDDINTVIAYVANKGLQEMDQVYYGTRLGKWKWGEITREIICPEIMPIGMPYINGLIQ